MKREWSSASGYHFQNLTAACGVIILTIEAE